jgi:hypothetical protein
LAAVSRRQPVDLDAHPADRNAPTPAIDLRVGFGADRFERVLERAEISIRINAEGDMKVDVSCSQMSRDQLGLPTCEDLGYEATQDDELHALPSSATRSRRSACSARARASGERSGSKSEANELLADVLSPLFTAAAERAQVGIETWGAHDGNAGVHR